MVDCIRSGGEGSAVEGDERSLWSVGMSFSVINSIRDSSAVYIIGL